MTDTFDAYRTAHHAHQAATTHAQAASARYTTERTRDAYEAMGAAWQAADRAMRVMFEARAAMCDVVLAGHQPAPDQPSTSTEGWHESADHIRWAPDQALAARQDA